MVDWPDPTRSNDYRNIFTNVYSIQFNGAEITIKFGIIDDLSKSTGAREDQVAVSMTGLTCKSLSYTLSALIEKYEKQTGQEIPLDPTAKANIDATIFGSDS